MTEECDAASSKIQLLFQFVKEKSLDEFKNIFNKSLEVANSYDVADKPKYCGRPRKDASTECPLDFYHRNLFVPLFDNFIDELDEKFQMHQDVLKSFKLVLFHPNLSANEICSGVDKLINVYGEYWETSRSQMVAEIYNVAAKAYEGRQSAGECY